MKIDADKVFLTLIVAMLGFVGKVVWDGVQIAEKNQVRLEMIEKNQDKLGVDVKELRRELYAIYPVMSDVAEAADIGVGVE